MDTLGKLFSSDPLVKIMRLFLMNQEEVFDLDDIKKRSIVKDASAKVELKLLESIGFLKTKTFYKEIEQKTRSKKEPIKTVKRKRKGWYLNEKFSYIDPLYSLLIEFDTLKKSDVAARFRPSGKIKLLVVSGVFIKDPESRADLLIVGDHLSKKKIENAVKVLESELGKEINYAVFDVEEFIYRRDMYDKLLCDVFEGNHEVIIENGNLSTEMLQNR